MAILAQRLPDNLPGKYYVDDQCLDCDLCRETAPDVFVRNDEKGYSFVHQQPLTPDAVARCEEVVQGCPHDAVGNDGERHDQMIGRASSIALGWLSRFAAVLFRRR